MRSSFDLRCLFLVLGSGCTHLGPVPVTTASSFRPEGRSDATVQAGLVPGWMLSEATQQDPKLQAQPQGTLWLEPGELLPVLEGVAAGARGSDHGGGYVEPLLRYRTEAHDVLGLGVVVGGTRSSGSEQRASYEAWRGTLELGANYRLTPRSPVAELHLHGGLGTQWLDARGAYCVGQDGLGVDCPEPPEPVTLTRGRLRGFFPSMVGGVALDFGRGLASPLHGGRVAFWGAAALMPRIVDGKQVGSPASAVAGVTLEFSLGATRHPKAP